ncbi:MAG: serine/threonine-protein kinase [Terracidiphilus sp.]|jgi:serine/threonine protein kinase
MYEDRWRYIRNIGAGGQGSVVLVTDESGSVPGEVALKRLIHADSQERRARFERETKALEALDHPNILKIHHKELQPASGDKPFFVAEYCSGGSLEGRGARSFKDKIAESAAVLAPIVQALEAAHRKEIFHRDCKPANILFRADGTPVLGDFGICHMEDGKFVTLADEGVGSKNFIAPEMESGGTGEVSDVTDAYSLAKVLYWMVSGGRIFARERHKESGNNLASSVERQRFEHLHMFLDKFLKFNPHERSRGGMSDFRRGLQELVMLVEGDFAPLVPDRAIKCRFCGLGTYQRSSNKSGSSVPQAGLSVAAGHYVVAMWCDHCGHIESFNLKASGYREWWNGKNEL